MPFGGGRSLRQPRGFLRSLLLHHGVDDEEVPLGRQGPREWARCVLGACGGSVCDAELWRRWSQNHRVLSERRVSIGLLDILVLGTAGVLFLRGGVRSGIVPAVTVTGRQQPPQYRGRRPQLVPAGRSCSSWPATCWWTGGDGAVCGGGGG